MDDLARFIEKTAQPALVEQILAHLDVCDACRVLLAASLGDARMEDGEPAAITLAPQTFSADEVVGGRYRIVRLLSRGGMGEVYEAWDLQLGESIALKTIACTGLDNASLYVRIRKEVQLARKVTHQNVCRILEFGFHQQTFRDQVEVIPFFTMELLCGETLAEYLARHTKVPTTDLLPIVEQILDGLGAIHAAGIVHRDLKPQNIFLLNEAKGQLRVVVMDFGLARVESGHASPTDSSSTSTVGTPTYMAPEQSLGGAPTVAWDIYALGVVLYRAITGEQPFKGNTAVALAMARITARAPKLSAIVPDVEPWLEQIVARCLEREPASRFASVAELQSAFVNRRAPASGVRKLQRLGLLASTALLAVLGGITWRASRQVMNSEPQASQRASALPKVAFASARFVRQLMATTDVSMLAGQGRQPDPPVAETSSSKRVEPVMQRQAPEPLAARVVKAPRARVQSPASLASASGRLPISGTEPVENEPPTPPGEDEIAVPDFARQLRRAPHSGEP